MEAKHQNNKAELMKLQAHSTNSHMQPEQLKPPVLIMSGSND